MKYKLKQVITNLQDREIAPDMYVRNGVVYVGDFKYEKDNWHIKVGNKYANLCGGIPSYTLETNPDADLFEPVEE